MVAFNQIKEHFVKADLIFCLDYNATDRIGEGMQALLEAGFIRKDTKPGHVRLRFFHDTDDIIYIETSSGKPRLPVGKVG